MSGFGDGGVAWKGPWVCPGTVEAISVKKMGWGEGAWKLGVSNEGWRGGGGGADVKCPKRYRWTQTDQELFTLPLGPDEISAQWYATSRLGVGCLGCLVFGDLPEYSLQHTFSTIRCPGFVLRIAGCKGTPH